jgi:putative nucleotidyltransferase with HDIG domain
MPLNEEETKKVISRLKDLPTLPQVVAKVMQIVSNPMASAADLNEVIAVDPALTAKVLRLANSAYYGFPKEITTIAQAVVILGFNTIRNLALSVSVHKMLFEGKDRSQFSPREFWKHSVGTAVASKMLARRIGFKAEENAFTAGLLHDIGKSFFEQFYHSDYMGALEGAQAGQQALWECERERMGLDHAQVGAWMAERWNLPADLQAAILHHHHPQEEGQHQVMVSLVHAANEICLMQGIGASGDRRAAALHPEVRRLLKLGDPELAVFHTDLAKSMKEAENFLVIGKRP